MYDQTEQAEVAAATAQTGIGHDNHRDHALYHTWKAARYYSSYEALGEILKQESHQHQTDARTKRIAVLEFSKNVLDHLIEYELKEVKKELDQYFNTLGSSQGAP